MGYILHRAGVVAIVGEQRRAGIFAAGLQMTIELNQI